MAKGPPTDDELRARPNVRRCSMQLYVQAHGLSLDTLGRDVGLSGSLLELWLDNGEPLTLRQSQFIDRFMERRSVPEASKEEIEAMLIEDTERRTPTRAPVAPLPRVEPPPAPVVRAAARRASKRTDDGEPLTNGKTAVVDFDQLVNDRQIEIAKQYEDTILAGLPAELVGFERVTAVNHRMQPLEVSVRPSGPVAVSRRLFTEMGQPRYVRAWWCAETKTFAFEALATKPADAKEVVYMVSQKRFLMPGTIALAVKAPVGRYKARHVRGKFWLCELDQSAADEAT